EALGSVGRGGGRGGERGGPGKHVLRRGPRGRRGDEAGRRRGGEAAGAGPQGRREGLSQTAVASSRLTSGSTPLQLEQGGQGRKGMVDAPGKSIAPLAVDSAGST